MWFIVYQLYLSKAIKIMSLSCGKSQLDKILIFKCFIVLCLEEFTFALVLGVLITNDIISIVVLYQ